MSRRRRWRTARTGRSHGCDNEGAVRFVNAASGELTGKLLTGHVGVVTDLAFSPDGTMLASPRPTDATVRALGVATSDPIGRPLHWPLEPRWDSRRLQPRQQNAHLRPATTTRCAYGDVVAGERKRTALTGQYSKARAWWFRPRWHSDHIRQLRSNDETVGCGHRKPGGHSHTGPVWPGCSRLSFGARREALGFGGNRRPLCDRWDPASVGNPSASHISTLVGAAF